MKSDAQGWRVATFRELIDDQIIEVGDGYRAKNAELGGEGVIFLRAGHVTDTHIEFDGADRFGVGVEGRVESKMARPFDVVVTTKGNSTGRVAFVDDRMPSFVYSPHLSYWRALGAETVDAHFLRQWSRGREFHDQLTGLKASTDMAPYLSLRDQHRLRITLPPIEDQRRIAAVLGALDDRIEVNRRMNRTLEAMAQALFRRRFVDFDGRDDLIESEAGQIPAGWRWGTPGDLIEFDPRVKLKKGTVARYLGMSEVPTEGFGVGTVEERPYAGGSKFILGDTLLARITPCLENGKTTLVDFLVPDEVAFGSTEFIVMRSRDGTPDGFVYCLARSAGFREFAIQHMSGSSGRQRVNRDAFEHFAMPHPPLSELAAFGETVRPWFARISANHRYSRTLTALRDTLLPKLISGEIRVPEAERTIDTLA